MRAEPRVPAAATRSSARLARAPYRAVAPRRVAGWRKRSRAKPSIAVATRASGARAVEPLRTVRRPTPDLAHLAATTATHTAPPPNLTSKISPLPLPVPLRASPSIPPPKTTTERLSSGERMASPKWESHCNSASGVWAGRVAMYAFDDARGPDPTLLAERFRVRAVATRDEDDATTSCVTSSALADADGRIRREEIEKASSDAPAISILRREREGAVYFEDGTLTAGPAAVRDETGAAVEGTAVFEFTIAAPGGGERAHATLEARVLEVLEEEDAGNSPDADDHRGSSPSDDGLRSRPRRRAYLSLAFERAYVALERWLGPERAVTDAQIADAADAAALESRVASSRGPLDASAFVGEWRSFNRVAASLGEKLDPSTGAVGAERRFAFEGEEIVQTVTTLASEDADKGADATRSGSRGGVVFEGDERRCHHRAVAFPGGVAVAARGTPGGGLVVSASWSTEPGVDKVLEREYECDTGALVEVRDCSRVRGRWVGGEM